MDGLILLGIIAIVALVAIVALGLDRRLRFRASEKEIEVETTQDKTN